MTSRPALLFCLLAACSKQPAHESPPVVAKPLPPVVVPVTPPTPPNADRCLPVVAAECGCVYTCGLGHPNGDGSYTVTHSFWTTPLRAKIQPWCVGGACTDAFAAEIVCDGICPPKPADPTCHLEAGVCRSERP